MRGGPALLYELQVGRDLGRALGLPAERGGRLRYRLVRERQLARGQDAHALEVGDGLARRGHHPPDAVDLVAEELDAHRRGGLGRIDVDHVTVDVEGTRYVDVACVGVAHRHEQAAHLGELHLLAHLERGAREVSRAGGRHAPHEGACRGDDHAGLTEVQRLDGCGARADHGVVCGLVRPRPVGAVTVAQHAVLTDPGRYRARHAVGRLLARHHQKARPGVLCPQRGDDERTGTLRHGQRGIVSPLQVRERRLEFGGRHELSGDTVYEHVTPRPLSVACGRARPQATEYTDLDGARDTLGRAPRLRHYPPTHSVPREMTPLA